MPLWIPFYDDSALNKMFLKALVKGTRIWFHREYLGFFSRSDLRAAFGDNASKSVNAAKRRQFQRIIAVIKRNFKHFIVPLKLTTLLRCTWIVESMTLNSPLNEFFYFLTSFFKFISPQKIFQGNVYFRFLGRTLAGFPKQTSIFQKRWEN